VSAVGKVVGMAVRRRRLQSLVIGAVVLLSTATAVLAVGLLAASDAPFDQAFARQYGAHATGSFDAGLASADQVAATRTRPGVVAAAGPYDAVTVGVDAGDIPLGRASVVGRSEGDAPVDRLTVDSGQWLTGPGQIVLSRELAGPPGTGVGDSITVDVPGSPTLRIVGIADSITSTADAWVWPGQADVLHASGVSATRQMLYRFASAGDDAAVRASVATATALLPRGALLGSASYLPHKLAADRSTAPVVPFVVAFAVLGLVMSALIVANVVNGAVVAGYRTIGMLKTLGFTPRQVVTTYAGQVLVPAVVGCVVGAPLGHLLALPLLSQTDRAYNVGSTPSLPIWVDVVVALGLPVLVCIAAVAPAWRAGRFSAVQAISVGRAPATGRGYRIRRALATVRLPRPVTFGLGTPFARPARSAVTVLAVLLGAMTVVFATGLAASLNGVAAAYTRTAQVPVEVDLPLMGTKNGPPIPTGDPAAVRATVAAQPGTARIAGIARATVSVAGLTQSVSLQAYDGDATWVGLVLVSGRWYAAPDEVVAASYLLRATGKSVGDTLTLSTDTGRRQVRVVGEAFDPRNNGLALTGGTGVLTGIVDHVTVTRFEVGLAPGTDADGYVRSLAPKLGHSALVEVRHQQATEQTFTILLGMVATLTVLLGTVAALGVFNTVVLNTRERVHEIGVLKSVGMTPRQVRAMVVVSMTVIGLVAGVLAVPLGYLLHHAILPVMANAAATGLPPSILDVYRPAELVALAGAGIVLAVLGALVPAGWAARARPATALRAE
jgi:putative ABC transport system permease protein